MQEFIAQLMKGPDVDGAYVIIPFDVQETFGAKRVKVKATFDGVAYRGSIVTMGGVPIIGVTKAIRAKIGKLPGDAIAVTVEQDTDERTIQLPDDARASLGEASALPFWEKLSYSHQREYVTWIEEAKKPETRQRRIEKMVEMLLDDQGK